MLIVNFRRSQYSLYKDSVITPEIKYLFEVFDKTCVRDMDEDTELHPIFTKDPDEWMQYVYKKVL